MNNNSSLVNYGKIVEASIRKIDQNILEDFIDYLVNLSKVGGAVFVAGNGGSAATSNHFVTDLSKSSSENLLIADSLCSNSSLITMIGNDYGFNQIFLHQLKIKANPKSILLILSASGNSENLISCIKWAKQRSIKTAALTGFDGGLIKTLVDYPIHIPSLTGEYELVEDCHSIVCHYIAMRLRNL